MPSYREFQWLRDQAIRLRRVKWANPTMLADEIWLMLQGLSPRAEEDVQFDDDGNPFTVPPINIPDLNLPDFDFGDPTGGTGQPPPGLPIPEGNIPPNDEEPDPEGDCKIQKVRSTVLGFVESAGDDGMYNVRIYPNGNWIESSSPFSFPEGGEDEAKKITIQAELMDPEFDDAAPMNEWTWVFSLLFWEHCPDEEPKLVDEQYFVKSHDRGVAMTTSEIAAIDEDGNFGSGTATARIPTPNGSGGITWSDGDEVTLYNMVSSEVESGKLVQWKKIAGLRVVDVEDCASPDDEAAVEG